MTNPEKFTAEDLVRREVHYCVSALVSTLAGGAGLTMMPERRSASALHELCDQALELCSPIEDYEEAARQNGWKTADLTPGMLVREVKGMNESDYINPLPNGGYNWRGACLADDLSPYFREVFEHWIVSEWLADKLQALDEKVDREFAGLTIWARTTTGQDIAMDSVIERIHAELMVAK